MTNRFITTRLPVGYLRREVPSLVDPDSYVLYELDTGGPMRFGYFIAIDGWGGGGPLPSVPFPTVADAIEDFKKRASARRSAGPAHGRVQGCAGSTTVAAVTE